MGNIKEMERINGLVENIVYRNESNDYTVLEILDASNELIVAVGSIPMTFEGERVELRGHWGFHKEFGKQFCFECYEKKLPDEIDGILKYLSSGTLKGIGPVTALKIVNKFGENAFDVIENHPEWLADISGITMKKAALISESFREQTGIRGVMMFCKDYISASDITKVYKKLGAGAVGIIQENPYILCDEEYGISFEKVDRFAQTLNIASDSRVRVLHGTRYVLSCNSVLNGHTCLPRERVISEASELLKIDASRFEAIFDSLIDNGDLTSYNLNGKSYIMTNEVYEAERFIASRIASLDLEAPKFAIDDVSSLLLKMESRFSIKYAEQQKNAIYEALAGGVMILTGGPGTGKTTVVKALMALFKSFDMKCVLAAPTGRAAKRLSEATGEEAKTIHRMLEMERGGDSKIRFARNSRNPLDEEAIIIDEASMVDLVIAEALLRAVRRGARLILIGDADQLPSVGAGNVFADLILSGCIRTVCLTEIFRQSKESLIIENAHIINKGEPPILSVTDNDFFFVRRDSESDIPSTIADLITNRLPKRYGADICGQIQVITPSKKGYGGVEVLNEKLQSMINPPAKFKNEKKHNGRIFREGDRVMQTVNNYDLEWEKHGYSGTGVFNGDIGVVESIDNNKERLTINFDDRLVAYDFELLDDLDLAYAITIHKSQGSEYPVVIIPMYYCSPMLMTRNLLYTAVTRARKMVLLVGRADIPLKMVENNREIMRYTTLRDRICDYYSH